MSGTGEEIYNSSPTSAWVNWVVLGDWWCKYDQINGSITTQLPYCILAWSLILVTVVVYHALVVSLATKNY